MAGAFQSKLICMVAKVYIEEEKKTIAEVELKKRMLLLLKSDR